MAELSLRRCTGFDWVNPLNLMLYRCRKYDNEFEGLTE